MLANLPANYKEEELEAQREAEKHAYEAQKLGYKQAQAVRNKLDEIISNPVVNTGLQLSSWMQKHTPGMPLVHDLPLIGKSPMDLLGEATNQLITKPLSHVTNVDPLWVDTALAAAPLGKAGLSKLLKGLKVGKGLKTVNQFTLPTSKRTPTTNLPADLKELKELVELTKQVDGSWGAGAGLAINPKHLDFAAKQMLGDAQQLAKYAPAVALPKLNSNTSTTVNNSDERTRMLEARAPLLAKLDEGINGILSQIAELPSKAKPGSVEALAITKLKKTITKLTRSKAAVIQTFYDDDMLARLYDNILSAAGISKEQELFFGRLKQAISIKGFNTPVHHNAWLKSFAEPFYNMDLGKGFDVQTILRDKHGRTLGDAMDNLTTFFDDKSHTLAHFGNTASTVLKEKLMNLDVTKMTAEEVADRIERIAQIADQQTGKAFNSKHHMEKGFELLESLPELFKKSLPSTLNPLDPSSPGWNELRLFWENADPDIKKLLNPDSQAMIERMSLDSMNIT